MYIFLRSDRRQTAIASTSIMAASAAVKAASRAVFGLGNSTPPSPDFRRITPQPRRDSSHPTGSVSLVPCRHSGLRAVAVAARVLVDPAHAQTDDRDLAPSNLPVELVEGRVTLSRDPSPASGPVTTMRRTAFGHGSLVQTSPPGDFGPPHSALDRPTRPRKGFRLPAHPRYTAAPRPLATSLPWPICACGRPF